MKHDRSETDAQFPERREVTNGSSVVSQRPNWFRGLAGDTKFAARMLAHSPGFMWTAVATLALGVGANLAFFSVAHSVLFRDLPYPGADRLVEIDNGFGGIGPTTVLREMSSAADYAGYLPNVEMNAEFAGETARLDTCTATSNLARVLGVYPLTGRWFATSEENLGHHRVAVISYRMWRTRFGADPQVLGRRLSLNEESYEIVGVMPSQFAFPSPRVELWTPIRLDPSNQGHMWGSLNLFPIGRLREGSTTDSGQTEFRTLVDRIRPMFPWRMPDAWGRGSSLVLHKQALVKGSRPKVIALAAASLLLLLISCFNVANLLLTRWIRRDTEFAIREALGATGWRLIRQLLTENLVLSLAGGAVGALVARALLEAIPFFLHELPRTNELSVGPTVLLVGIGAMFATLALLSLVPMLRAYVRDNHGRASSRVTSAKGSTRLSFVLAGFQLALATTLLIGANLMGRTLWQLDNVDSGIRAPKVTAGILSAGPRRCGTTDRCWAFLQDLTTTLSAVPGIRSVNWANGTPLTRKVSAMSVDVQDHRREPGSPAVVLWYATATPGYFGALGIPLRAGRLFEDSDRAGALPVAIISESTAKKFWPSESAIGKVIRPVSGKIGRTVVGVVGDVAHYSLVGFPTWIDGVQYVPLEQARPRSAEVLQLSVFLETNAPDTTVLQSAIRQRFPDVVLSGLTSLRAVRDASISDRRSTAWLLTFLAALGLLLGIVGVYGVMVQRSAQRTREIGIRIAMGATTVDIARLILREALSVGVVGSVSGILVALALSKFLRSLLFGVSEHDAMAYAAGSAILLATAVLAATVPGLRASRLDAAKVLRAD